MNQDRALPGSKPIALAVAAVVFVILVGLPFAIVVVFYLFANVDAIVIGTRFGSRTLTLDGFLAGLVLSVGLLIVVLSVAVGLLGRSLAPKAAAGSRPNGLPNGGMKFPHSLPIRTSHGRGGVQMLKRVLAAFGAVLLALGGISVAYARSHANPTLSVSKSTRSFPGGRHPATADPTGLTGETGATGDESVTGTTGDQGDQSDQGGD